MRKLLHEFIHSLNREQPHRAAADPRTRPTDFGPSVCLYRLLSSAVCTHHRRLSSPLSPKTGTHFTVQWL